MQDVFTFAQKPVLSDNVKRGRVINVDTTIFQVEIMVNELRLVLPIEPQDCTEALRGIVLSNDPVVRIDCDVDMVLRRLTGLHLTIDPVAMGHRLEQGGFHSEEHVINLARGVWREAHVPPEVYEETTFMNDDTCPSWKEHEFPLFPHQRRTVSWMRIHGAEDATGDGRALKDVD